MEYKYTNVATREIYTKAVEYYSLNSISIKDCAIKFNIDRHNLSRWIRRNGGKTNLHGKYPINSLIFNLIDSEEKAYWLGFLYADGYVSDGNSVSLELSLKDKKHLQRFNTFMGRNKEIKEDSYRVRCIFKDTSISTDLKSLGVIPRKSLILTFPTEMQVPDKFIRHFIRGYIDGDGSIYITNNNIMLSVLGTKEFLSELLKRIDMGKRTLYRKNQSSSNSYFFQCSGEKAIKTIQYLYSDCTIFLERKYDKFLEYCRHKKKFL